MKIAIAQINTTIGDFDGNSARILDRTDQARKQGAWLVIFPELAICGYPPRDLLEKPGFIRRNLAALANLARKSGDVAIVVGHASINKAREGKGLFNSASILKNGKVVFVQHKMLLPEYDVFEEARHFEPAQEYGVYEHKGVRIGLSICEDLWSSFEFGGRKLYRNDPVQRAVEAKADVVLSISASPFTMGKRAIRKKLVSDAAVRLGKPVFYCNLVGGNDELVFDGLSFVVNGKGKIVCEAKAFEEDFIVVDLKNLKAARAVSKMTDEEEVRRALRLGLKDYMRKCGFERVVIGLSGGIDSAVVAAIACEAIGKDKVMGVMMPSPYSSPGSITDSEQLAKNLGMITCRIDIGPIYESYKRTLGAASEKNGITLMEENLQARIRGNILMAISNREGALVLSTGNKSEVSVGYCTLYGDMAGGLAIISDIPKTFVYALARHLNSGREIIPRSIMTKPPSAELRPGQLDTDRLPPYDKLDPVIRAYVEEHLDVREIVALGYEKKMVERVVGLIDQNEYKRRQAAPGIKITSKAFGPGRRFPIAWKP